jgi:hypothetical protein
MLSKMAGSLWVPKWVKIPFTCIMQIAGIALTLYAVINYCNIFISKQSHETDRRTHYNSAIYFLH